MKHEEKMAYRDAAVRGVPFFCGGHIIQAAPYDDYHCANCCDYCEMDSECNGDIFEMCEFVNGFKGYDEFYFKMIEKQTNHEQY